MRAVDTLILKEINQIDKLIILLQNSINQSFEDVHRQLLLILKRMEDAEEDYVSPELEQAIKTVALRARSIDEQVP
jgi:hypothetical protein